MKQYNLLYLDPPWKFKNKNTGGSMKSGSASHYNVGDVDYITSAYDIPAMSADNAVMFMWWVAAMPLEAIACANT